MARFILAFLIGIGVADLFWRHIGTHLSVTTDIVGRTTFADFDIYRYLDRFYDVILVFPAVTILAYVLVARFGLLRAPRPFRPWPPSLEDAAPLSAPPAPAKQRHSYVAAQILWPLWVVARIALPAFTVGIEINAAVSTHSETLSGTSLIGGLVYAAAVIVVATLIFLLRRSRPLTDDSASADRHQVDHMRRLVRDLTMVNSVAAIAVIPLLVVVSSSTAVTIASTHKVNHYPWFPLWFGILATAAAMAILLRALVRAHDDRSLLQVERRVLLIVVVPILLFMITTALPGAQGAFSGFDDAQAMVGAQLSFGHGLWPWRDIFLLHGFLTDALYGEIGMWVLSATRWGSNAGVSFFVAPFTIVGLFAFIVYFARRNRLLILAGTLALLLGLLPGWSITRYVFLPVVLILFDRVLRLGSWGRCVLFMAAVVLLSIVTPEATELVLGVVLTLVVAEAVHRSHGERLADSFVRTIRCAVAGVGLTAVWVLFLKLTGTFAGFIAYYQTTISGHELWGAYSPQWSLTGNVLITIEFALPIALFLLTVCKVVTKLRRRTPWRSIEWVLVASSTPVILFYQVVLDRMDGGHVNEVFQTLIPFVVLWAFEFVRLGDDLVFRASNWLVRRWRATARFPITVPVTFLSVIAIALGSPTSLTSWKSIPADFHPAVPVAAPSGLPLGYTVPGTVDTAQIDDLGKVLDRYAGPSGPVFDFTNEMGVTYFLLNRVPGARFYHVESAQTARAQILEVGDLERSRPRVVIFNDVTFGIPNYDGIWSMERNYLVSQYILDHYRPLLATHDQLILLRDDLFARAQPLPRLSAPPVTTGLYFDMPSCNWGDVPDFLIHPAASTEGRGLTLQAQPEGGLENLVTDTGWAFDTPDGKPAREVLAVSNGRVIGSVVPSGPRTDVAAILNTEAAAASGFEIQFPLAIGATYRLYVLNADGSVSALTRPSGEHIQSALPATVTTPDGVVHALRGPAWEGNIDSVSIARSTRLFSLNIPPGTDLASYQWMDMIASSGFGHSSIELTDQPIAGVSHMVQFDTLPRVGKSVFTRVGSCLQWHGYNTTKLTLLVKGPPKALTVRLFK